MIGRRDENEIIKNGELSKEWEIIEKVKKKMEKVILREKLIEWKEL
jgi:hypothetical protein